MIKLFFKEKSGSTSVEFAFLIPVFILLVFGSVNLALALSAKNCMQEVAQEVARCVAIKSAECETIPSGCTEATAALCFTRKLVNMRGHKVDTSKVIVDEEYAIGSITFTQVQITYDYFVVGRNIELKTSASFPNS